MAHSYATLLQHLFARSAMGMRMGLEVTRTLLAALDHPDAAFDHVIVAGTNGKGSTSALLSQGLTQSGYRAGLFTSPHLCRYTERVRVNGQEMAQTDVVRLLGALQAAEKQAAVQASFFEATTLLACLYFREQQVDVAVMECGLGGRLDATNALQAQRRRLSIITPIDLDHQHILGPDTATIAQEKACVMRPGVLCVTAPQSENVMAVLQRHARATGAVLTEAAPAPQGGRPTLPGYLEGNRRLADGARQALLPHNPAFGPEPFDAAVRAFCWPGRYQKLLPQRPLGPSYLIDGSHNPAGMAALCRTLSADAALEGKRLHAVFAVMPHKDAAAMEQLLTPHVASLRRCGLALHQSGAGAPPLPGAKVLLQQMDRDLGPKDVVLVVGSLYLAGEALAHLCGQPIDPPVHG